MPGRDEVQAVHVGIEGGMNQLREALVLRLPLFFHKAVGKEAEPPARKEIFFLVASSAGRHMILDALRSTRH